MSTVIQSGKQIEYLIKQGKKLVSASFIVFYSHNLHHALLSSEFAVIAGKKVFKKAVERNFAKRRLRALVRQVGSMPLSQAGSSLIESGLSVVIMARRPVMEQQYALLVEEFFTLTKRVLN